MRRLSIARSLRLALIGLTVVLTFIAAVGVADLYGARQRYVDAIARSSQLSVADAELQTAGVVDAEVLRDAQGRQAPAQRRRARLEFERAAAVTERLAAGDPVSARLVAAQLSEQAAVRRQTSTGRLAVGGRAALNRAGQLANEVAARQQVRQLAARNASRAGSRRALLLVAIAGGLAVAAALALIAALVRSMRHPLDELVEFTQALAAGQLSRRVVPQGPTELQNLAAAFNTMGERLAEAQDRIEQQRRRLATTIESLSDGLLVTEEGSVISTVNPRAAELVGELAPGDRVDAERSPLPPLASALTREVVIDHGGRTLAVTAAPLGAESDGVVWTVRDVTEQVRLERAKTEFVATASHELRSPLTSIKGFAELMSQDPESMSLRQREFLEIILSSADRLVELVDDLLDVARIEADSVEIARRPVDVGEIVRDVVELMRPRIEQHDQHLGIYIAPTLPLALGDGARIRQIVANLVTNAHLYTPDGGRIHVGVESDRAWVRLVVADSGLGMAPDERERVFERFYRSEAASAKPGTGLGLSIVSSLVELHEGRIEVESELGRGSTFQVLLPAAIVATDSEQSMEIMRGRRVLVVDDEPEAAAQVVDHLEPLGVQAVCAEAEGALLRLREERFDAVVLDGASGAFDGPRLLDEIRSDPELRGLPLLLVTDPGDDEQPTGEWSVARPIDPERLRAVIVSAVGAGRSRVLVVAREQLAAALEPALDELGIEHQWESSGAAAARLCAERRFELALLDVGIRHPHAALQALDLRGRRLRRSVILVSDGAEPVPSAIVKLGIDVVAVQDAPQALINALRGDREQVTEKA